MAPSGQQPLPHVATGPASEAVAILGPTASGKSALALALAEQCGGEIVGCDSVQIYRGFDIGSAKATAQERQRIRHHLIDVVDGDAAFDAQQYRTLATAALADIAARGRRAIICGGTGLYLRALRWGLIEAPAADLGRREQLQQREQESPGALYAQLRAVDPVTAARTEPNNIVHIIRAIEIYERSGTPASKLRETHAFAEAQVAMRVFALQLPSELLRERIEQRTDAMLRGGLVEEVRQLLDAGVPETARPLGAVGYREALAVIRGTLTVEEARAAIIKSTWHYARRQRTWLRKERDVTTIEVDQAEDAAASLHRLVERIAHAMGWL